MHAEDWNVQCAHERTASTCVGYLSANALNENFIALTAAGRFALGQIARRCGAKVKEVFESCRREERIMGKHHVVDVAKCFVVRVS